MKKKLVYSLLAISTLLTGCNTKVDRKTNKNQNNEPKFIEETEANDSLFDNVKMLDNFEATSDDVPAIGIQSTPVSEGKISIRFIGAIKVVDMDDDNDVDNDDLKLTTAVWHRGMYAYEDGSAIKSASDKESQFAYTYFNDGGAPRTIEEYNTAHGTQYTHFVTYVLKDIPVSSYGTAYLNVNLTVNDTVNSKYAVTTVDRSTQFTYENDKTGYFGIKKTATGYETFDALTLINNSIYSSRLETNFVYGESFVVVNKGNDTFKVYDFDSIETDDAECTKDGTTNFVKPPMNSFFYTLMKKHSDSADTINNITSTGYVKSGDTVYYGIYPQTVVSDSALITSLNALTSDDIGINGWYYYKNPNSNENKGYYTKIKAAPKYSGQTYFENGSPVTANTYYWFKCESIVWKILPNTTNWLLSEKVLDADTYVVGNEPHHFEDSHIRHFLNNEFLVSAFAFGNSSINVSFVDNGIEHSYEGTGTIHNNTYDRIYLPSQAEYSNSNYGFGDNSEGKNKARLCWPTDYALARGVLFMRNSSTVEGVDAKGAASYWTRSIGGGNDYGGCFVNVLSSYSLSYINNTYDVGVRPCLHLNID